jgi:hypothetical protein
LDSFGKFAHVGHLGQYPIDVDACIVYLFFFLKISKFFVGFFLNPTPQEYIFLLTILFPNYLAKEILYNLLLAVFFFSQLLTIHFKPFLDLSIEMVDLVVQTEKGFVGVRVLFYLFLQRTHVQETAG